MRIDIPARIAAHIDQFTGREWLLPVLSDWLENASSRLLLLTGEPGSGKSMIAAWLAGAGPEPQEPQAREMLQRIRSMVKAVHFCEADSYTISPRAFTENVSNQLIGAIREFKSIDVPKINIEVDLSDGEINKGNVSGVVIQNLVINSEDEESFERLLRHPLINLYQGGFSEPILMIVDALDEAATYTGSITLVNLLARTQDFPAPVHILATTRSDPRVLKYFPGGGRFDLSYDEPPGVNDVGDYVTARLSGFPNLTRNEASELVKKVTQASQANFLFANLVLEEIIQRLQSGEEVMKFSLPQGLKDIYQNFLNRELGRNGEAWVETFRPLLGLLAVGQPPGLTNSQLCKILGRSSEYLTQALYTCREFLQGELPHGPFRLFHQSFQDFLLDRESNPFYSIDAARMHARIADYYLHILGL